MPKAKAGAKSTKATKPKKATKKVPKKKEQSESVEVVAVAVSVDPMPGVRHPIAWPHAEVTAKKFLPTGANDYDGCWVVMGPYQRTPYVYLKATGWLSYPKHVEYEKKHVEEGK
jgi:hypothetical protein